MDLIRAILVYAEEYEGKGAPLIDRKNLPEVFHDVPDKKWVLHCDLIVKRGLATGAVDVGKRFGLASITWEGYDFLDKTIELSILFQ